MTAQSDAVDSYVHLLKGYVSRVGYIPAFSEWSEWIVKESGTDEDFILELTKAAGGYESVLSQLYQPKGGSENFTNLRSPGQDDALVAATPGTSGTSAVHRTQRATSQETVEQFTDRALDVSGERGEGPDYAKNPKEYVGSTTQHPAYGSGRRNISGVGYGPDMTGKDTLGKFLTQWERERHTAKGISPGPTIPSPTTGIPGERIKDEEEETEAELAQRIVDETTKPTVPNPEFAPTQPTETTRHSMGTLPGEKRLTEHPSYTEFKKRRGR